MHHDVTNCVTRISNNLEYLEKEGSYKNSAKEVTLSFKQSLQHNQKNVRQNFVAYTTHKMTSNFSCAEPNANELKQMP